MDDLIYRRAAIDKLKEHRALYCDNTPDTFSKLSYAEKCRVDELDTAIATLVNQPSAQGDAEFINWLLDEIWDEEMWELNYRAFPELLCRRLARLGYLKEEGGVYVRLDKQTGGD